MRRPDAHVSAVLFLCVFAAQSGLIALSPVLADAARDLGVSTAAAGQLRTIAGLAAGFTAFALPAATRRLGPRRLLVAAALVLAAGSAASAAAPSFAVLALAQLPVGAAVSALVATSTAAAVDWAPAARATVLSRALLGNPVAWLVGMPLVGLLGSWRCAWLALPLAAGLAAALAAARAPASSRTAAPAGGHRATWADARLRRWLLAELAASSGWLGLLVYAGALFTDSYGTSSAAVGALLALTAAAFVGGNLAFRRAAETDPGGHLARLSLAMAALVALLGLVRPAAPVSAGLLAACAFLGGGRTLLGNAYGISAPPERRLAAMAARAAANQFGYFVGAAAAGLALAGFGYGGLGLVLAALFAGAALLLTPPRRRPATSPARPSRRAVPARAR